MNKTKKQDIKTIEMFEISYTISNNIELMKGLSKEGIETFKSTVCGHIFPFYVIVIEEYRQCEIAREIISIIMKELPLMSFVWYENIYKAIYTLLEQKFNEVKK